jgi:ubiquitin C-terminal hydrolase
MKKIIYLALLVSFILCLPYVIDFRSRFTNFNPWARFDLSQLCIKSDEILKSHTDSIKRIYTFYDQLNSWVYSPTTKNIFAAISTADPESKINLFELALEEIGFPNYRCPPLIKLIGPKAN